MKYKILFSEKIKRATIKLPASKSICNRALIINALCESNAEIRNIADCDDSKALLDALELEGQHFDVGAAGTAMRFLTAFLARRQGEWSITGTERMKLRPIGLLVDALNGLGAEIKYLGRHGFPPLQISGRELAGGETALPGDVSSQYVSALLMIAPMMDKGLLIRLAGEIASLPYIHLTVGLMRRFNARVEWEDARTLRVWPQKYVSTPLTVEPDWSAASYWYSVVSLSPDSEIELSDLSPDSMQGDSAVAKIYERLGVRTIFTDKGAVIRQEAAHCERLDYDFADTPDLAQTLAVSCCLLHVPFRFLGLRTLKIKETDRIAALITELSRLGYVLEGDAESLEWNGDLCPADQLPLIHTYEDHRMAMAFAPAAIKFKEGIEIAHPEVVSKSYPAFWEDLASAGINFRSS